MSGSDIRAGGPDVTGGSVALVAHTLEGRILFANQAFERQQGTNVAELRSAKPWAWSSTPRHRIEETLERIRTEGHLVFDRPRTGGAGPFRIESWLVDLAGEPVIVSVSRDMQQEQRDATDLAFRSMLLDQVSDAVICHTLDGQLVYVNEAACQQRGFRREELLEKRLHDIIGEYGAARVDDLLARIASGGSAVFESDGRRSDGTTFPVEVHARLTEFDGRQVVVSIVRDITERKRVQAEIEHLAFFDNLTGLPNRRLLMDRLSVALTAARRTGEKVAVAFIDMDHLKRVNDQLGHAAGDRLLHAVGQRIIASLRSSDTVARFGGDEFVVLCPGLADAAAAQSVARKIMDALREPFEVEGQRLHVTVSLGLALNEPPEVSPEEILANADTAMYGVKMESRDDWGMYSPELAAAALADQRLLEDLERAIDAGELLVYYQQQVRLADGCVAGVEALVRWNHPELGLLTPARFLPLAEESGLIVALGEWVLREACAQHAAWVAQGLPAVRMAVNLSFRQMAQPGLPGMVRSVVGECGMAPELLELEIAEKDVVRATASMRRSLQQLHDMGVRLVIDDFGRGFAADRHVYGLPVDAIKVNRCVVPGGSEAIGGAVASAVLRLAEGLSMETIIECVENEEQLELFRDGSADGVQGFVFSEAVPAENLVDILRKGFAQGAPRANP